MDSDTARKKVKKTVNGWQYFKAGEFKNRASLKLKEPIIPKAFWKDANNYVTVIELLLHIEDRATLNNLKKIGASNYPGKTFQTFYIPKLQPF